MLRKIIRCAEKSGSFLAFKSVAIKSYPLHTLPLYTFSRDKPPKGFEKFQRRRKTQTTEEESEDTKQPKEQKIEKNQEEEDVQAESSKKTRPEKSFEEETNFEKQRKKERDAEREREKRDARRKREEEEEEMENEDEKPEKKQHKKPESPFNFNQGFKWGGTGDNKGGDKKGGPNEWWNAQKLGPRHFILLSLVGFLFAQSLIEYYYEKNNITYVEFFKNYFEQERIKKITIRKMNDGSVYRTVAVLDTDEGEKSLVLGNVDNFIENLEKFQLEKGKTSDNLIPIEFEHRADPNKIFDRVVSVAYFGVTMGIFYIIFKQVKAGASMFGKGGSDIFGAGKSQVKIYGLDQKVKTRFDDVAGLDEAKVEIMEFVDFLKKPQRFKEVGATIPRGALLSGPPGTGKTLLAKAAAGEAGVPFLYISGSDFVEMFVGVGASRVRDLFKKAKEHSPSIIFIDEIDAVGRKRESKFGGNDERDNTLNQLLVEMDGFGTDAGVIILAATNRKELLDPALTRPGRFDRSIEVTLPDIDGRRQIFLVHLQSLKLDTSKSIEEYARRLATLTPGFSGADIANLCNEAAILAARRQKDHITTDEFEAASERVMAGLEKKKIISEEERRTVAVHESGHAVVSWFLEGGTPLVKLTIIPRSKGSLGYAQYLPNESSLETKEELLDRITCILGGRCSEELFNNKVTTGAYDDLQKAYEVAYNMVTKFGMSEKIGFLGFNDEDYVKKYSNTTAKEIDDEIARIIEECTERSRQTVRKYKTEIEKLSAALLEKETLDLQTIIEILGERPYAAKSNFKAYLEYKKKEEQFAGEIKEEEAKDDNNNSGGDSGEKVANPSA